MKIAEITINFKPIRRACELTQITNSKQLSDFFRSIWSHRIEYVEEFYLLLLNRGNKILGFVKLSEGGTCGTVVDIKMIFQAALKANAQYIVVCHNHPSGGLQPSQTDIYLTKKIADAGRLIGIELLDHIILTAESYYSFVDEGVL